MGDRAPGGITPGDSSEMGRPASEPAQTRCGTPGHQPQVDGDRAAGSSRSQKARDKALANRKLARDGGDPLADGRPAKRIPRFAAAAVRRTSGRMASRTMKAQSNFTDPESSIMKTSSEGFQPCYNA